MTNYEIKYNDKYNSHEVYFDGKPSRATLDALKALKMRWNHVKSCWYGYAQEHELVSAIIANDRDGEDITGEKTEGATVYTDGYLGGGAVYGSKSDKHLYGADLSKAIREDIKAAGIKGVSVRCKTYSGGQSITVTLSLPQSAFVPEADFVADYQIKGNQHWLYYYDSFGEVQSIHIDNYFAADAVEQEKIRTSVAMYEYDIETRHEYAINQYHVESDKSITEETGKLINKIKSIIESYRYDESNAMVDYFDTNFYYDIRTKPLVK